MRIGLQSFAASIAVLGIGLGRTAALLGDIERWLERLPRVPRAFQSDREAIEPPMIVLPGPLHPGQTGERELHFENTGSHTEELRFRPSDLISTSGERLAANALSLDPSSPRIAPREVGAVLIRVRVPMGAHAGAYAGTLACEGSRRRQFGVRVTVA